MTCFRVLRHWLQGRFVDNVPMAVLFGLPLLVAASIPFLASGALIAYSIPISTSTTAAANLLDDTHRDGYLFALVQMQSECRDSLPPGEVCSEKFLANSSKAFRTLQNETADAGLKGCRFNEVRAGRFLESDVFLCEGPPEPSPGRLSLTLVCLAAFAVIGALVAFGRAASSRSLLPKFNPRLWITPWAALVVLVAAAPLSVFAAAIVDRVDPQMSTLTGGVGVLLAALTIAGFVVADLRTFEQEREYIWGLLLLGLAFPIIIGAGVLIYRIGYTATGLGAGLIAFGFLAALFAAIWFLRRRRNAGLVGRATVWFLWRWLLLNCLTIVAILLYLRGDDRNALVMMGFSLAWTLLAERWMQTTEGLCYAKS